MNLEELQDRKRQLEDGIEKTTQSVYMLQGHKAEVDFQISELLKQDENKDAQPTVNSEEPIVEC